MAWRVRRRAPEVYYIAVKPCGCVVRAHGAGMSGLRVNINRWLNRGWTIGRVGRTEATSRLTNCTCEPSPALAVQLELEAVR